MPFVQVNGVSLHYQELGSGEPMVMLHGLLLDNLSLWYFVAAGIEKGRRRALMFDLRGHGKSDKAERGYDLATLASDLAGFVDATAPEAKVDLCAYSYGALVAIRYALDHPDRVRRMVIVEAPLPPNDFNADYWQGADLETLLKALPESLRKAVLSSPARALKLASRVKFLARKTSLIGDVTSEPAFDDTALRHLTTPTLCIYGDRSEFRENADRLIATLPNASLRVLEGTHRLLNEQSSQVASLVEEFLDGPDRS